MGPILLLDKSTFQSLARGELTRLRGHFLETLPPILVHEIVGDLALELEQGASADEVVLKLASKFGGSGPVTMWDYRTLGIQSLAGNDVPMDGRIPARTAVPVPDPDGQGYGMFIDLAPENHALLRWARGQFSPEERERSAVWRAEADVLSTEPLEEALRARHVVFPRCNNLAEAVQATDALLATSSLQGTFIEWILEALEASPSWRAYIRLRWNTVGKFLSHFAPYAYHCTRALLLFIIARHFQLVTQRPTDLRDMQYLYYAPFCMAFCSNDRLHKALAPHVLRADQVFVVGENLKSDLRRLREGWDALDEAARDRRAFAFGGYPAPAPDSVICQLWGRFCLPWGPRMGNQAVSLNEDEQRLAIDEARQLFRDSGLGFNYAPVESG